MMQVLAIACGGACGALIRFWLANAVHDQLGRDFPYGTFVVNLIGCLFIGILYVWFTERFKFDPIWRAGLMVGVLGALTTFSTFSIETVTLLQEGRWIIGLLNIMLSVTVCLLATLLGVLIGRTI